MLPGVNFFSRMRGIKNLFPIPISGIWLFYFTSFNFHFWQDRPYLGSLMTFQNGYGLCSRKCSLLHKHRNSPNKWEALVGFVFLGFFLVSTCPFPISLKHQVVSLIHIVQYRCKCTNCHYRFLVGSQPTTLAYALTSVIYHCSFENLFLKSGILGWKENGKDVDMSICLYTIL